jgi:hypothetical protein
VWDVVTDDDEILLPTRAEDLLMLLASPKGLGHTHRGARHPDVAKAYKASPSEAFRAYVQLSTTMERHYTVLSYGRYALTRENARRALDDAYHHLEDEPVVL